MACTCNSVTLAKSWALNYWESLLQWEGWCPWHSNIFKAKGFLCSMAKCRDSEAFGHKLLSVVICSGSPVVICSKPMQVVYEYLSECIWCWSPPRLDVPSLGEGEHLQKCEGNVIWGPVFEHRDGRMSRAQNLADGSDWLKLRDWIELWSFLCVDWETKDMKISWQSYFLWQSKQLLLSPFCPHAAAMTCVQSPFTLQLWAQGVTAGSWCIFSPGISQKRWMKLMGNKQISFPAVTYLHS